MDSKAMFSLSCGLYVVGTKVGDKLGGCIVDALIQSTALPTTVLLCSICKNLTCDMIKESGLFSVSVLRKDVDPHVIANFGGISRRDWDKWGHVDGWIEKQGLPVLPDVAAWMVCRVKSVHELGTHTLFHALVEDAEIGEGDPLTYGEYRANIQKGTVPLFKAVRERAASEKKTL